MYINEATNEELVREQTRLRDVFEKCKENLKILYETMEKASGQYNEIEKILIKRGYGNKREQHK